MIRFSATAPCRAFALVALLGALVLAFAATACGVGKNGQRATPTTATVANSTEAAVADSIPTVDITVTDSAYDAPDTFRGGLTRIRLHNKGTEDHQAQLLRLKDGVTVEQLRATLGPAGMTVSEIEGLFTRVTFAGGVGSVAPGATSDAVLDLQPGTYVLLCFNVAPDGNAHWEHGEFKTIDVTSTPGQQPARPLGIATIRLSEFAFDAPGTLAAGRTVVNVTNAGTQWHEMAVVRQDSGGRRIAAGGLALMSPEKTSWVTLDLTPGTYVLICNARDVATGKSHSDLGMARTFTVLR